MCGTCWDADVMEEKIRSGDTSCTGLDMKQLSRNELIYSLTEAWKETRKNCFRIYKEAVPSIKEETISWMVDDPQNMGTKQKVTAKFI